MKASSGHSTYLKLKAEEIDKESLVFVKAIKHMRRHSEKCFINIKDDKEDSLLHHIT